MRNFEVVSTRGIVNNPFKECIYFVNRFAALELLFKLLRLVLCGKNKVGRASSLLEYYLYKVFFLGISVRNIYNPFDGSKLIHFGHYLAYQSYKSAIRTSTAIKSEFNIHNWLPREKKIRNVYAGNILHYDLFDAEYFIAKFSQRSHDFKTAMSPFYLRQFLGLVVESNNKKLVNDFFIRCVAITSTNKIKNLIRRGIILKIDSVQNFLTKHSTHSD